MSRAAKIIRNVLLELFVADPAEERRRGRVVIAFVTHLKKVVEPNLVFLNIVCFIASGAKFCTLSWPWH
jgi:hypothetical protein